MPQALLRRGNHVRLIRHAINLNDELDWTDAHQVTGAEFGFLNTLAVDVGAVGGTEVFDADTVICANQAAMFARDIAYGDAEIAIFPATHDGHVANDRKASTLAVAAKHYQHNLHDCSSDLNDSC